MTLDSEASLAPEHARRLEAVLERLERARPFAKAGPQSACLGALRRAMSQPGGVAHVYGLAGRLDAAGLFLGTDWAYPAVLLPGLVRATLEGGGRDAIVLELVSELRLLAVARGDLVLEGISPEQARHFLTQVLALDLQRVMSGPDEVLRTRLGPLADTVGATFQFVLTHVGIDDILGSLIAEIWRILRQRPLQVDAVKGMVSQMAAALADGRVRGGDVRLGADRLVSALFGPTEGCADDPGLITYRTRLAAMDPAALASEARGFARAMHDVGLVSDYHAVFVRWLLEHDHGALLADALGLSSTGLDARRTYSALVERLVMEAIEPATSQAVYGLALLLERGILYAPPVAPGLWRQIQLSLSPQVESLLRRATGDAVSPRTRLLAGVIGLLGQPLGVGQGNNPTCQSARALSMWSLQDPDRLLQLVARAARFDTIEMYFEGEAIRTADLAHIPATVPMDADPVSVLLVPHLDRIYAHMGRLVADRGGDPHRWINPEFHGWWVGRGFALAVDVPTGKLVDHKGFVERFYRAYHPYHNGGMPLIHPQPAGLAVTDSTARFVGWHAITLLRVAIDHEQVMRVYFYNPNNDSGQDWGDDVVVSTHGHGERFGEASLPFPQLVSRLYIFHDDPVSAFEAVEVPEAELQQVVDMTSRSWGVGRDPVLGVAQG